MLELSAGLLSGFSKNGPTDPIEYYRRPLLGWLFRERINIGLRMLGDRRFARALEVGYGAGVLQGVLAPAVDELHGIDLDADPAVVAASLEQRGLRSQLVRGSVYEMPYASESFDLVFCFSVFEHLHEYRRALAEVARVLAPGGLFLLGMPAVNLFMELGFAAIGFRGIEDHHVTTPADVERAFPEVGFRRRDAAYLHLPPRAPFGARVYSNWLLQKKPA